MTFWARALWVSWETAVAISLEFGWSSFLWSIPSLDVGHPMIRRLQKKERLSALRFLHKIIRNTKHSFFYNYKHHKKGPLLIFWFPGLLVVFIEPKFKRIFLCYFWTRMRISNIKIESFNNHHSLHPMTYKCPKETSFAIDAGRDHRIVGQNIKVA